MPRLRTLRLSDGQRTTAAERATPYLTGLKRTSQSILILAFLMVTITVPDGYQYVGAALLSTVWLLVYQVRNVGKFRKSSGVKYPQLYAEKAEVAASIEALKFNCAQRTHQGTLEFLPVIYPTALIAGLKFPHLAAASVVLWTIGRTSFTRGYLTGDPEKRVTNLYKLSYLGLFGLLFTSTYVAGEWVVAGICSASKL